MVQEFLVTFRPLEPFAFGSERNFDFKYRDSKQEPTFSTYFVTTNPMPEQTTVFGTLRYCLLEQQGLIKSNFDYNDEEKAAMAALVGRESFRFEASEQDFGNIQSMSGIFLLKKGENGQEVVISMPFNNKSETAFSPMLLSPTTVATSKGQMALVDSGDYSAKTGYGSGFYNATKGIKLEEEAIFTSQVVTGNGQSEQSGQRDKDLDFFKRQVHVMKPDFSFAVYLTLKAAEGMKLDGYECLAMMGQKKSLFQVSFQQVSEHHHLKTVQSDLAKRTPSGLTWEYALSDLYFGPSGYVHNQFAIMEKKSLRNLETDLSADRLVKRIRRSDKQFNLIKRGSVFYGPESSLKNQVSATCDRIGLNHILEIKGEEK